MIPLPILAVSHDPRVGQTPGPRRRQYAIIVVAPTMVHAILPEPDGTCMVMGDFSGRKEPNGPNGIHAAMSTLDVGRHMAKAMASSNDQDFETMVAQLQTARAALVAADQN